MDTINVAADDMLDCFAGILRKIGFSEDRALQCATVFTNNSIDGVYTHGVNRFPRFVKYVLDGYVKPGAVPERVTALGGIEQWNGNLGPGPLNAIQATERVMELASHHGIGCVALANTNHWMRAGAYGWQAAKKGFVFIGWTNTIANMPAWGAVDAKLGNNPLVFAAPYHNDAIVLDMAMSQFSLGAMEQAALKNQQMPVNAGYDSDDKLTTDPAAILATRRLIPTGYWKGSGLSLLLDILATVLSNGLATHQIGKEGVEFGLSQVYIAIDLSKLPNHSAIGGTIRSIIEDYHRSRPLDPSSEILFPGQRVLQTRMSNGDNGIPVQKKIWDIILRLQTDTTDTSHIAYI